MPVRQGEGTVCGARSLCVHMAYNARRKEEHRDAEPVEDGRDDYDVVDGRVVEDEVAEAGGRENGCDAREVLAHPITVDVSILHFDANNPSRREDCVHHYRGWGADERLRDRHASTDNAPGFARADAAVPLAHLRGVEPRAKVGIEPRYPRAELRVVLLHLCSRALRRDDTADVLRQAHAAESAVDVGGMHDRERVEEELVLNGGECEVWPASDDIEESRAFDVTDLRARGFLAAAVAESPADADVIDARQHLLHPPQ